VVEIITNNVELLLIFQVKQLENENRFLKMRLENQNLGMQESLQEELLVMYNR